MRLNRFVAGASGLSRRAADAAIAAGRITVNGQPVALGALVAPGDTIELDGQPLVLPQTHHYIMLNKPVGYVSSRRQQGGNPTVYDLLPPHYAALRPVGRLDRDSSGLLLLSDDGDFIHRYTHPSFGKDKLYELALERPLTSADRRQLEAGVALADGPSRVRVAQAAGRQVAVVLGEGRNRQLRRTFGALGYGVTRLHRTAMGPYRLGQLAIGAWVAVEPEAAA
ncbi:MAG TPA: pseudouridine synthase [Candidatus Saccharimonadia bacterium]|nr:pseudouridine synthase [Candidatus Saccharimonadia bacterium]